MKISIFAEKGMILTDGKVYNDAFSLAMMAYGKHLITDQGYGAQLTGDIYKLMSVSSTHNVVLADDVENTLKTVFAFYESAKNDGKEIIL